MTERERAEQEYIKKFGGIPYFLIMGAEDDYVIEKLRECVRTGKELKPEDDGDY